MTNKFASLHAGLLARKGEAAPANASPLSIYADHPRSAAPAVSIRRDAGGQDGYSVAAAKPAVAVAYAAPGGDAEAADARALQARLAAAHQAAGHDPQHGDGHHGKYRFTMRLTSEQRRRLRTAAAQMDSSLQDVLSGALDKYLDGLCACSLKECACLARRDDPEREDAAGPTAKSA